ncbi:hypothetical protein scyTo_0011958, partial [Scyliorhinus torazame]|nr:hypothetical protein [Scyliorhinus torazame]
RKKLTEVQFMETMGVRILFDENLNAEIFQWTGRQRVRPWVSLTAKDMCGSRDL